MDCKKRERNRGVCRPSEEKWCSELPSLCGVGWFFGWLLIWLTGWLIYSLILQPLIIPFPYTTPSSPPNHTIQSPTSSLLLLLFLLFTHCLSINGISLLWVYLKATDSTEQYQGTDNRYYSLLCCIFWSSQESFQFEPR